jgi:negative regulator of flagellin synthesis FlgM
MIDGITGRPAGLGGSSPLRGDTPAAQTGPTGKVAEAALPEGAPRAEISALAAEAREAASAPIDTARVAALRESIANGSYTVDPEKIAAKMIELDLGWTAKGGA